MIIYNSVYEQQVSIIHNDNIINDVKQLYDLLDTKWVHVEFLNINGIEYFIWHKLYDENIDNPIRIGLVTKDRCFYGSVLITTENGMNEDELDNFYQFYKYSTVDDIGLNEEYTTLMDIDIIESIIMIEMEN